MAILVPAKSMLQLTELHSQGVSFWESGAGVAGDVMNADAASTRLVACSMPSYVLRVCVHAFLCACVCTVVRHLQYPGG